MGRGSLIRLISEQLTSLRPLHIFPLFNLLRVSSTPRAWRQSARHGSMATASSSSLSLAVRQPALFSLQSLQLQLLVLRFVPLRDKLLQLSHLSTAFFRLTPACFSQDGLKISEGDAVTRSAQLQALFSCVRQLTVGTAIPRLLKVPKLGPQIVLPPRLALRLSGFSRLQSLSVQLDQHEWYAAAHSPLDLQDVLTPLSSLPLLHSLSIDATPLRVKHRPARVTGGIRRSVRVSDLVLLSRLPSLRSLTVGDLPLLVGSLSLLCSLPLEHLDLRRAHLGDTEEEAELMPTPALFAPASDVAFSLRRLLLPTASSQLAVAEIRRVLLAYGIDRIGRDDAELRQPAVQLELMQISLDDMREPRLQQLLWSIPSLTQLTVTKALVSGSFPQPASAGLGAPAAALCLGGVRLQYSPFRSFACGRCGLRRLSFGLLRPAAAARNVLAAQPSRYRAHLAGRLPLSAAQAPRTGGGLSWAAGRLLRCTVLRSAAAASHAESDERQPQHGSAGLSAARLSGRRAH